MLNRKASGYEKNGWCISPTLEAKYTLYALREAISQAEGYDLSKLIHHSDRGVQYCCNAYIDELNSYHIDISMTEDYKPTDNALTERVNGIIKTEKLYRQPLYASIEDAKDGIGRFITGPRFLSVWKGDRRKKGNSHEIAKDYPKTPKNIRFSSKNPLILLTLLYKMKKIGIFYCLFLFI